MNNAETMCEPETVDNTVRSTHHKSATPSKVPVTELKFIIVL